MDKELTVEDRLRALYDLQLIDTRIDQIRLIQGELPLEVRDMEDEVVGTETRLARLVEENKKFEEQVKELKNTIVGSKDQIQKYEEQQKTVRNNREYDAISKEIEYQGLEIQHAERLIRDSGAKIEMQKARIAEMEEKLEQKKANLVEKKEELDGIMAENAREEQVLVAYAEEFSKKIDQRLLTAYRKIRSRMRNGLAVVSIDRGASEGSFFTIPAQRQIEIAARKKIITDEYSGRILVDPELAADERVKMEAIFAEIGE